MSSSISNTISGGISFGGISSGSDFDSMIEQLKSIEEIPKTRYTVWQGEWEYRIAAMEEVLLAMEDAKSVLQGFDNVSDMLSVTVDSSDDDVAIANTVLGSDLTSGNYSIDVEQIAKPSLFSTKQIFDSKTTIINDTGTDQYFEYTYKGETRTISMPHGSTLDQLVMRINNDADNPGVSATLLKNGSGYMFQIQGDDTGVDSSLNVSSDMALFSSNTKLYNSQEVSINNTGSTKSISLTYNHKNMTMDIPDGMTAQEFIDSFNTSVENPGLKASLTLSGNDYVMSFEDKATGAGVALPIDSDLAVFGGGGGLTSPDAVINDSDTVQNYTYSYLGTNYTVSVSDGQTLQGLADQINNHPQNTVDGERLVNVSVVEKDGLYELEFKATDAELTAEGAEKTTIKYTANNTEYSFDVHGGTSVKGYVNLFNTAAKSSNSGITAELVANADGTQSIRYFKGEGATKTDVTDTLEMESTIAGTKGDTGFTLTEGIADVGSYSNMDGLGKREAISGKQAILNNTDTSASYSFTHNGTDYSMTIEPGTTLEEFAANFNSLGYDLTAKVVAKPSGYELIYEDASGAEVIPESVNTTLPQLQRGGDNWYSQEAQDAKYTINGWDVEFTSASNTLTEVIDGLSITIKSEGQTNLTVVSDTTVLEENIVEIVDALNLVKGMILELQKVDDSKDTSSPTEGDLSSQFTWQMGGALTGNYGVQLLLSNFNSITTSSAEGFIKRTSPTDTLNDLFTSFSQIGITTVTTVGEDDHGLLEIDTEELRAAIAEDAEAVAQLFSAQLTGDTNSTDFTVASAGLFAKAGTYDVDYTVDDTGVVTEVYINGAKASTDPNFPGRYTVGDSTNAALGVAVQFSTSGLTPGNHSGAIQIKQGIVNEMINFMDQELTRTDVEGEEQGTLPTIISNYMDIITNLQTKIDNETKRIESWEDTMVSRFARLEGTLAEYDAVQSTFNSMLPSSSSSDS